MAWSRGYTTARQAKLETFLATFQQPSHVPTDAELLQNEIHPIFARSRFTNISDEEYELMGDAFRFASKCMQHDGACRWVDTMTNGLYYHDSADHTKRGEPINLDTFWDMDDKKEPPDKTRRLCFPDPEKQNIDGIRSRAEKTWSKLTYMVTWTFYREQNRKDCKGCLGLTYAHEKAKWPSLAGNRLPPACSSHISVNRKILDKLKEAHGDLRKRHVYLDLVTQLATTLLHELAHAVQIGVWGSRREEAYYKNEPFAEAGFQLESVLFGGLVKNERCQGQTVRTIHLWPAAGHMTLYQERRHMLGVRTQMTGFDVCHALSYGKRVAPLTEAFWNDTTRTRPLYARDTPWLLYEYDPEQKSFVERPEIDENADARLAPVLRALRQADASSSAFPSLDEGP